MLPDLDGWELLAQIKKFDSALVKVPVVIVSVVDERARGFSLGMANAFCKNRDYARQLDGHPLGPGSDAKALQRNGAGD